ncbi:MAG TPA: rod shape-determining protein MreC [Longimicrobiales bacterium]|nr:rod shape-determining protein MreC [Longimicrobiales bacterium]
MAVYGPERETQGRQIAFAAGVMLLALATPYLSEGVQDQIASTLQASALRPFIVTQQRLTEERANAERIDDLRSELDSVTAITSTQAALADENRTLRELLGLAERARPAFVPATVLRPGTPGSESMFLVDVGYVDGVREDAPIVSAHGLVGVIHDVRERTARGIDWTSPDFRASAMLEDGSAFGIVENVRGASREQDRLRLNGIAYYATVPEGARVLTSGLAVYPRGIPIGTIEELAETQGEWLRSYWLRPAVQPASVTHVLVETVEGRDDLLDLWNADSLAVGSPDSAAAAAPAGIGGAGVPRRGPGR